ncbi:VOC family protein [Hamadaea tsunoensis]|uniref:VOC family protein n=1 Tax=Hamadaea tsunoensis TaxID=53368 RepID=UPI0003FD5E2A|nr:VOC family protein [Hamadaea tsunoensis]
MALGRVAQIHISVTDLDRAVAFYRDILELPLLFVVPGHSDTAPGADLEAPRSASRPGGMAFFQAGDVRLYLGVPEAPEFRSHTVVYYEVADIDAEYARLITLGVAFLDEPHVVHRDEAGELWMAFLSDPDGHHIAITQQK